LSSRAEGRFAVPVLLVAVAAISSAAILVRLGTGVHPVALAAWRAGIVAVLLAPTWRPFGRRDGALVVLSGLCLALHFGTWFASISHTTVLRSTVFVCLNPIWVGLGEWLLLKRPPGWRYWLGVAVAVLGVAGMGGDLDGGSLYGDALALVGGLFGSAYLLTGRVVRQRVAIGSYACSVCAVACAALTVVGVSASVPLGGFSMPQWTVIAALALGPHMIGHNGVNYALKYLPAAPVAAVILLEPVGAAALAAGLFGERPSRPELLGGFVILIGVWMATWRGAAEVVDPVR